ncbi:MAG: dTDP-4-dehydrorhamnose reductase [Acidobacteria bacterium]|nr:dTDP-4-dehydrorhamnose reductase [Acidobacteriota bacterium]
MSIASRAVLVTGADGQLGRAIADRFGIGAVMHALGRRDLDITDAGAVAGVFARHRPGLVINCAAFTDVDGAEDRPLEALAVNGLAPGILARAAEAAGATLVHFSTDFVFAGREDRPWTEADAPEPQSVYAQSKLVGEWLARDCRRHYTLRVESLFGGPRARSTIDRITEGLRAGREVTLFHDRTVTPSFTADVAEATHALLAQGAAPGVYHCVNSGATTWLGLGRHIARLLGLDERLLVPVSVADVRLRAARPQYAALSNRRLADAGVPMPAWEDALARYLVRPSA